MNYNTETIAHLESKVAEAQGVNADATDDASMNIRSSAAWAQKNLDSLKVSCPNCKAKPGQVCVWRSTHSKGAMHTPRLRKAAK